MILCKKEFRKAIDQSVFPGLQGGPHMNQVAATAIALGKALQPDFKDYCRQVLANAQALAGALLDGGAALVTGGTTNHMMVVDCIRSFGMNGRQAEETLDEVAITCNKQVIPDDPNPPLRPSGHPPRDARRDDQRHARGRDEDPRHMHDRGPAAAGRLRRPEPRPDPRAESVRPVSRAGPPSLTRGPIRYA